MNPNQEIIREILEKRGITGAETQAEFLAETPKLAYAPTLLTNMDKGVDRLLQAIDAERESLSTEIMMPTALPPRLCCSKYCGV